MIMNKTMVSVLLSLRFHGSYNLELGLFAEENLVHPRCKNL